MLIDLNADLGEGGAYDDQLLDFVSSASIACGGHAGDDDTMARVLIAAKSKGVRTGAHPGFDDPANFGRRELNLPHSQIIDQILKQMERIHAVASDVGQPVSYLKLHGALYNMAARDQSLAVDILGAVQSEFGDLAVMALDGSAQVTTAERLSLPVIREGFADRAYSSDGKLVSRSVSGAVLDAPESAVAQAVLMARDRQIVAIDGTVLQTQVQSICLHGDNVAALDLAKAVRRGLEAADILVGAGA